MTTIECLPKELAVLILQYIDDIECVLDSKFVSKWFLDAVKSFVCWRFRSFFPKNISSLRMDQIKSMWHLQQLRDKDVSSVCLRMQDNHHHPLVVVQECSRIWKVHNQKVLIVVQPKKLLFWIKAFKGFGYKIVGTQPENSDVLVYHSKYANHQKYFKKISQKTFDVVRPHILLTTITFINPFTKVSITNQLHALLKSKKIRTVVFDEVEYMTPFQYTTFCSFAEENLYLSTLEITNQYKNSIVSYYKSVVDVNKPKQRTFKVECEYVKIPRKKPLFAYKSFPTFLDPKKSKKVVLFVTMPSKTVSKFLDLCRVSLKDWHWYRKYGSGKSSSCFLSADVEKWVEDTEPCVLVIQHNRENIPTVSVSNIADTFICLDYDEYSLDCARKQFECSRRFSNTKNIVRNYFLYEDHRSISSVLCRLNVEYAVRQNLVFDKKHGSYIRQIVEALEKDGLDVLKLSSADFLSIFANQHPDHPFDFELSEHELSFQQLLNYSNISPIFRL